MTPLFM